MFFTAAAAMLLTAILIHNKGNTPYDPEETQQYIANQDIDSSFNAEQPAHP
jgi:hypothetical protein